ncbi:MAG: TetR/AcrR family transcriptional regulator [Peptostreptococcaceae bacterium]
MSPKISNDRKEQQKNKIINGAIEVFRQKGYEQTTMKDIRESAGVSAGSLYMYFSNKEEIFINILEQRIHKQDLKITLSGNESYWEQIETYINNIKDYCIHIQEDIAPIAYEYTISAWREHHRKSFLTTRYDMGREYIKSLIEKGITIGEFDKNVDSILISNFIITSFEGLNTLSLSLGHEKINIDEQIELLKEILKFKLKIK